MKVMYTSLSTASSLFDIEGANSVKLMLKNPMEAKLVADKLISTLNDKIYPQIDANSSTNIYSITSGKNMMFFY